MGIAVDLWGNAYVTGFAEDTFWPDAFIAKYDRHGKQVWIELFGAPGGKWGAGDWGIGIAVDRWGNAYVAGCTMGTFPGQTFAGGWCDAFIAKYDRYGEQKWIKQFGTLGDEDAWGIALNHWGDIYVSGCTDGAFSDYDQTFAGGWCDAYIAKLR